MSICAISPCNSSRDKLRAADTVPDPATHPIIAWHWFGFGIESLRRHRQFEHVHRLGPRAVEELVVEVANGEDLDRALAAYQRLTPELLEATSGDRFPPAPIYEVRS